MKLFTRLSSRLVYIIIIFIWTVIFICIHYYSVSIGQGGFAPIVMGGDDGRYYFQVASDFANGSKEKLPNIYPYILGLLMRHTGIQDLFFYKILNFLVSIFVLVMMVKLFHELVKPFYLDKYSVNHRQDHVCQVKFVVMVVLFAGIYPSLLFFSFSYSLLRDAWVYAFTTSVIYYQLKHINSDGVMSEIYCVSLFIISWVVLYAFRWYIALSVNVGYVVYINLCLVLRKHLKGSYRKLAIMYFVCIALGIVGYYYATLGADSLPFSRIEYFNYRDNYENIEVSGVKPTQNIGIDFRKDNIYLWPILYVYSILSNSFGPLLWQIKNMKSLLGFAEGVCIMMLVLGCYMNRKHFDFKDNLITVQALTWISIVSLFNDNVGTAMRLRVPAVLILIVLYCHLSYKKSCT